MILHMIFYPFYSMGTNVKYKYKKRICSISDILFVTKRKMIEFEFTNENKTLSNIKKDICFQASKNRSNDC